MQQEFIPPRRRMSVFSHWMRTGHLPLVASSDQTIELKFNPYHDPTNGQFTFGPDGTSGGADMARRPVLPQRQPGQEDPRFRAIDQQVQKKITAADPHNPRNYSVYEVQSGDTLTHIAAKRIGITPDDLKWLNALPSDVIKVGQQIKLPTQAHLDEGKRAFDTFNALSAYMNAHGGQSPPDVAHPPSLVEQAYGPGSKAVGKKGYTFNLDPLARTRSLHGEVTLGRSEPRSRSNQARAGGADRRHADDGGHFIAHRFNGPSDAFNHFAQDASFNRGVYRKVEDGWAKELKNGRHVSVDIAVEYEATSLRPKSLVVNWRVNGQKYAQRFSNAPKGK